MNREQQEKFLRVFESLSAVDKASVNSFAEFLARNVNSENAQAIVAAEKKEIALYERFKEQYSYGVYIARKLG